MSKVNEEFERWYCNIYWNFKFGDYRQVFFSDGEYNHRDVDLAYNSWLAGRTAALDEAAEVASTCMSHLASPLASYNHGVADTQRKIQEVILKLKEAGE